MNGTAASKQRQTTVAQVRKAALDCPLALAHDDQPAVVPADQRRQVLPRPRLGRVFLGTAAGPEKRPQQLDRILVLLFIGEAAGVGVAVIAGDYQSPALAQPIHQLPEAIARSVRFFVWAATTAGPSFLSSCRWISGSSGHLCQTNSRGLAGMEPTQSANGAFKQIGVHVRPGKDERAGGLVVVQLRAARQAKCLGEPVGLGGNLGRANLDANGRKPTLLACRHNQRQFTQRKAVENQDRRANAGRD